MRLVCPNCGAQYEVDDRVIPEGGRDVQCSNCGHAWFQRPANWGVGDADDAGSEPAPLPEDDHADYVDADEDDDDLPEDITDEPPHPAPPRRPMSDNVRDILETEAQRELDARSRESVEVQEELGIGAYGDPEAERRRIARERMARMRGIEEGETLEPEVEPEPEPEPEPATLAERRGREVFPDIEEINSTLDGNRGTDHSDPAPTPEISEFAQKGSSGFRRGFSAVLILAALALGLYLLAPRIVDLLPASAGIMAQYVDLVNGFIAWINAMVVDAVARLESAAQAS
ncbi:zinc-ribbon domain-containing protein [Maritimibacter sp. DP1N21-5]|uniref:zinc-ribbon domain-containing protein n=1 Tax=Maritimibacter sp. DP1N21-5 TaxID=2836867 RepID=UPI00210651BA|nr:zinc-ribbon domain-containing protein [Maritimibacter sp. DP1N21-5]